MVYEDNIPEQIIFIVFPENVSFPEADEKLLFEGTKLTGFPREQSLRNSISKQMFSRHLQATVYPYLLR